MKPAYKIGIAGCGIGGLAAGAFLAKAGHSVTIFDKFQQPAPVGSGLVIQPAGQDVLRMLGALEPVLSMGNSITHMHGHLTQSGRTVLKATYGTRFGLAIGRPSLFAALLGAAKSAGCTICAASHVTASKLIADQRFIQLDNDDRAGPFDLVIDASGISSPLSPMVRAPLPYGALWGNVDWPDDTNFPTNQLTQCYARASKMAGIMPIGTFPNDLRPKAAIFWSITPGDFAKWRSNSIENWKAEVTQHWPEAAPFFRSITKHSDLIFAQYSHGTLATPYQERLAFIGDAAHVTSPQLGQGANMALLDAYALDLALREAPLDRALPIYAKSRRWHIRTYQLMSQIFTPMYQSDSRTLPVIRDWMLAPAVQIPPANWIASKLVCGDIIRPLLGR